MVTVVPEHLSSRLISHETAFAPIRRSLVAAASEAARVYPAVIAFASDPRDRFSIKSGATAELAGLKVGAFWHNNPARGLPRHNSTILLIDQDCGRIGAVVEAAAANAYRTAAADAVAAQALARPDSETLALFGAGNQALYEVGALARILPLRRLHIVARDRAKAETFAARLAEQGVSLDVRVSEAEEACRAADVIVTATPSQAPLFAADWVRPGTHVAGMGSDGRGKQELPVELFERARLFCDLPAQSIEIGEFQHVRDRIESGALTLTAIGAVLDGRELGRTSPDEITVFDSSGIALQDLYIGQFLVEAARDAEWS